MKEKQKQMYHRYQNQSLMALGTNNQGEPTKKIIETQELYNSQPIMQANNRVYIFRLPIETDIGSLVSSLTSKFASSVIHAEEDEIGAQIILQGLECSGLRAKLAKFLDYFVFCCSKGLRFGRLQQTYNVILLTIRKQVIDNHCLITVINPYSNMATFDLNQLFLRKILDPIQEEFKLILKQDQKQSQQEHIFINPILEESSPIKLDIHIHKKVYELFVLLDNKEYSRYKSIFLHSLQKINEDIAKYRQNFNSLASSRRTPNPSVITESLVLQSEVLLQSLKNSYQEQDRSEMAYLHPLLCSETAETVTLFTIEEVICLYELPALKQLYLGTISKQCDSYNENVQKINRSKSDEQCFEHLTLKKKYRLPEEEKPYHSAIERLKSIQHCNSLRQALLVIQQTFSDVKTDCFVSHRGKVQLSSMDELLPVIIFVSVRAAVHNFPVWITMIGDYVRVKGVFQLQQRIMTAFYAAIEDVSQGWEQPKPK